MNLNSITAAELKKIIGLLERKETLQAQVAQLDAELAAYQTGGATKASPDSPGRTPGLPKPVVAAQPKARKGKRTNRGELKSTIINLVKSAGKSGITVSEIAAKLSVSNARVFSWLYTTGKAVKEIKKAGPGKYTWAGPAAPVVSLPPAFKPAPALKAPPITKATPSIKTPVVAKPLPKVKPPQSARGKGVKPGATKDRIIGFLKGAGKGGLTVAEVAAKLGVDTQRMYVWFGATGKAVKEIKKIAPAKYAWVS